MVIVNVLALALAAYLIVSGVWALLTGTPITTGTARSAWPTQRTAISFCFTFGGAMLTGTLVDIASSAGWIDPVTALWLISLPVALLLVAVLAFRPRRPLTNR